MRIENFKSRMANRDMMAGTFLKTPAYELVEVLATSQLDFICIDMEHSPFDRARTDACLAVARALALRTGEPVIEVRRTLSFGGVPTILEELWLPGDRFKGLSAERLAASHGPMYAMFEAEFGISMVRADERLRAVLPDEQQAQWLQVSTSTPLLSVERVAFTYNDLPMELRRGLYRTDMHHYRNQLF